MMSTAFVATIFCALVVEVYSDAVLADHEYQLRLFYQCNNKSEEEFQKEFNHYKDLNARFESIRYEKQGAKILRKEMEEKKRELLWKIADESNGLQTRIDTCHFTKTFEKDVEEKQKHWSEQILELIERLERERLERERERLERERMEKERLERERMEKERLERERMEKLERERQEREDRERQERNAITTPGTGTTSITKEEETESEIPTSTESTQKTQEESEIPTSTVNPKPTEEGGMTENEIQSSTTEPPKKEEKNSEKEKQKELES